MNTNTIYHFIEIPLSLRISKIEKSFFYFINKKLDMKSSDDLIADLFHEVSTKIKEENLILTFNVVNISNAQVFLFDFFSKNGTLFNDNNKIYYEGLNTIQNELTKNTFIVPLNELEIQSNTYEIITILAQDYKKTEKFKKQLEKKLVISNNIKRIKI